MNSATDQNQRLVPPRGLTDRAGAWPTVFVDAKGIDLQRAEGKKLDKINAALYESLQRVHGAPPAGQGLLKVHIGEPKCGTRMRPEYAAAAAAFARDGGASLVAGDTTVAYTGRRGHKENPPGDAGAYLRLARKHGWSAEGSAKAPFVVLDRPVTALKGIFEFHRQERRDEVAGIKRFHDFYLAEGFAAADFVVNYAHLTLHGLAGVAGCVKSVAMGCSSLRGKLRMHQSLLPRFDAELCVLCGRCVESCPVGALSIPDDAPCPVVFPELCIGCGECEAVCALGKKAVKLYNEDVHDWSRGEATLPVRMADYTLGLMNGRWERTVHVLHLYSITSLCDCVDHPQKPMLKRDLGFLVGQNPFAIDALAGRMLADALKEDGAPAQGPGLTTAEQAAQYVRDSYGILPATEVETVVV